MAMAKPTVLCCHLEPWELIKVKSEGIYDKVMFHGNEKNKTISFAKHLPFLLKANLVNVSHFTIRYTPKIR